MRKPDTKKYSLFTGCVIPSKFPFIEKASRKVLESLGLKLEDIEEASCCPNQMAIKSSDDSLWHVLAARNLCLAENLGHDIVTLCNGCYDTLKTVNSRLKRDDRLRKEINEKLGELGLEFHGEIEIKHIIQVLHDDIGLNAIEKKITQPLRKLKCAPFEGCHVTRPMDHMGFEDPKKPSYLRDLIKVMGGDPISYSEQYSCCGGGLSVGRKDDVIPAARRIFLSSLGAGARAIVTNCPFCFAQFYRSQKEINDNYAEGLHLPVFYITQLMGLTFGISPEELGMELHYKDSVGEERKLLKQLQGEKIDKRVFTDEVTQSQLELCAKCFACTDDCPTAMTTSEYHPEEILELVLNGKVNEAIKREDLWFCMNCHECIERCPQRFGMVKLILRLKNLAVASGIYPEVIGHRTSELHDSGYSFSPDMDIREEFDLPKISMPDIKKLRKLMEETKAEHSNDGDD